MIDVLRIHSERDLVEALGEFVRAGSVSPKFLPEALQELLKVFNMVRG
jgi:hypothetical protein